MLRVTFDSNVWERVAAPDRYPKDSCNPAIAAIRQAIEAGALTGYVCVSCVTHEAIKRVDRHRYFSGHTSKVVFEDLPSEGGTIHMQATFTGDDDKHPGLTPHLSDRLPRAVSELGFRLLPVPRLGTAKPNELSQDWFAPSIYADPWEYNERFAEAARAIEVTGRGFAVAENLTSQIEKRVGTRSDYVWRDYLKLANDDEVKRIPDAIAEWADGDAVASHIAYRNDIFCTLDRGISARMSVFDADSRSDLSMKFGIRFLGLEGLAAELPKIP